MCKCKLKSSPIFSKFTRTVDKIDFAKLFFADSRYKYKLLAFLMILKIAQTVKILTYCLYYATIRKHSNLHWIDRLQFPWLTVSIQSAKETKKITTYRKKKSGNS